MKKDINIKRVLHSVIMCLLLILSILCIILRFAHPDYTETELLFAIPKALMLK